MVSERQSEVIRAVCSLYAQGRYIASAQQIALRLGYRPSRKGILPVTSSLRALERAGLVARHPPEDQWSVAGWSPTKAAQKLSA